MHEHNHIHKLKYCEKCDVVYCEDCKREWVIARGTSYQWIYPYYPYYPYQNPYPTWSIGDPTDDLTPSNTGEWAISSDVTIDCTTDAICSH